MTLVISKISPPSAPTFQHILHRSIDLKLIFTLAWWCTVPSTLNLLLLPLMVVYQIQPSNVVELQQHSPLSNHTSVTTYVHRMIISPPCLFKHMKNNERVSKLIQCLLDHTQQKLYFCLISLLRNNVSNSVYINLRHSVYVCLHMCESR